MRTLTPTTAKAMHGWPRFSATASRWWQRAVEALPHWMRHWQFWLVLVLGATLRLAGIGRSPFGSDDALLFLEAARTTHDRLLPGTGIFNSLLALNFPAYTFLLLPFANQPQGMATLTALLNVVAVGCLYVFAVRMFGKWAGFVAGLLFATATYATWMSVFIWQQTIVVPITLVALWLAFEGAVRRRRHWFAPHAILLALAIQIYPQTASLLLVTLCAVVLGWRTIHWLDVLIAENVIVLIWLPTVLFELASGGYDVPIYTSWLHAPKVGDTQALNALSQALGPQAPDYFGPGTWYMRVAPVFGWLAPLLMVLWAAGTLWVIARVVAPLALALRKRDSQALWRTLSAPAWRGHLLLLLWPLGLLAATVRHATPIYIHYVFFIAPVIYVTIALLVVDAPRWLAARIQRRWHWATSAGRIVAGGAATILPLAQVIVTTVFVLTLATGQAWAVSWGAIPISGYTRTLAATTTVARTIGADRVFVASDPGDVYMGQYWAARQNDLAAISWPTWVSYSAGDCAISAARAGSPALVLVTATPGPALASLLRAPTAHLVDTYPAARGARLALYEVGASRPTTVPLATVRGAFQLDTTSITSTPGFSGSWIISRWTALASTPPGPGVAEYTFQWSFRAPDGATSQQRTTCAPTTWRTGDQMVLAVPVPAQMAGGQGWSTSVAVTRDTHTWYQPHLGAFVLDTAKELTVDYAGLPPWPLLIPTPR